MKIKKKGNLESYERITRNGWTIQMSTWMDHYILVIINSIFTNQTILRHFDDENEAAMFVDFVVDNHDAAEELDI
jgi:hypothetical protein